MKKYLFVILFLIGCNEKFPRPDYSRVEGDYYGQAVYLAKFMQDTICMNVTVSPYGANYILNFELNGIQKVKIETCIPYEFLHEYLFFSYLDNQNFWQEPCGIDENRFTIPIEQNSSRKVDLSFRILGHFPDSTFKLEYYGVQVD